jgi:hypothetical protein
MSYSSQLDLYTPLAPLGSRARGLTLEQQFLAFHRTNPHVYQALRRLALELVGRGHRRIGIKMLFEVLRWQYALRTDDPNSEFKLNNAYTSFYARLLNQEPELCGCFELRTQTWQQHEIGRL